jgi:hypothetical protein
MSPPIQPDSVPGAQLPSRRVRLIWICTGLSLLPAPVMLLLPTVWAGLPAVGRWVILGASGILMAVVVVLILMDDSDAA